MAARRALAEGTDRAGELRHPERAAAWLRARVLRQLRSSGERPSGVRERHAVLSELGLAEPAADALAQLSLSERAALIAAAVEDLAMADVATVLGSDPAAARRRLVTARTKYLAAARYWLARVPMASVPGGSLARRIDEAAARAIGRQPLERDAAHD